MCERLDATGLALYKRPERLEIVAALPATASGKIQKHELVRALTAATEGRSGVSDAGAGDDETNGSTGG